MGAILGAMSSLPPQSEMERAYRARDRRYDGIFFVGVRTTGIFCRPTCPAKSPLPKNVEYFASPSHALFAGYRACKRCRPLATANQPDWATALLSEIDGDSAIRLKESDLRARGLDPSTVRRFFTKNYGMTFNAYQRARRLSTAFQSIKSGTALDHVGIDVGYESASGFRDAFSRTFGCTPGRVPTHDSVFLAWIQSPLGPLVAGATDAGVCLLEFTDRRMLEKQFESLRKWFRSPIVPGSHVHLDRLREELASYFAGSLRRFSVPLVHPGTPFQQRVWDELLRVPYGETRSYQDLAKSIGDAAAVRAVGRTNGLNRIAILIPCHRIVNKNGDLGGYGGGLRRKQFLLDLERNAVRSTHRNVLTREKTR